MSDFDDHHIISKLPDTPREKLERPLEDNLLDAYRFFAKLPSKVPAVEYDTDARRELLNEGLSIVLPIDVQATRRRIDQAFTTKPVPFKLKALPVLWSGMGLFFAFNAGDDLRLLLTDSAGPLTIAGFISSIIAAPLSLFNARSYYKQRIVTEMHDKLIAPMFKLAAPETEPAEQGSGTDSRKLEEVSKLMQLTLHPLSHNPMDEDDLTAINEGCRNSCLNL